jgi:hypothetical protein
MSEGDGRHDEQVDAVGRLQAARLIEMPDEDTQVIAAIVEVGELERELAANALIEAAGGRILGPATGPDDEQPAAGRPYGRLDSVE